MTTKCSQGGSGVATADCGEAPIITIENALSQVQVAKSTWATSKVTFDVSKANLDAETEYQVHMTRGMFRDYGGLPGATILNASSHTLNFVTVDNIPPVIESHVPTQGKQGVSRYAPTFSFLWSEPVIAKDSGGVPSITLYKKEDGSRVMDWAISDQIGVEIPGMATMGPNGRLMTLTLPVSPLADGSASPPLDPSTTYYFEFATGVVHDLPSVVQPQGNDNAEVNGWSDHEA